MAVPSELRGGTAGVIGVAVRNQTAALALVLSDHFFVRRVDLSARRTRRPLEDLARRTLALALDYEVTTVVVEATSGLMDMLVPHGVAPICTTLEEASALLTPTRAVTSQCMLFRALIDRHPELTRFLRTFTDGSFAASHAERRRTVALLAVAIALAGRKKSSTNQQQL